MSDYYRVLLPLSFPCQHPSPHGFRVRRRPTLTPSATHGRQRTVRPDGPPPRRNRHLSSNLLWVFSGVSHGPSGTGGVIPQDGRSWDRSEQSTESSQVRRSEGKKRRRTKHLTQSLSLYGDITEEEVLYGGLKTYGRGPDGDPVYL